MAQNLARTHLSSQPRSSGGCIATAVPSGPSLYPAGEKEGGSERRDPTPHVTPPGAAQNSLRSAAVFAKKTKNKIILLPKRFSFWHVCSRDFRLVANREIGKFKVRRGRVPI